MRYSSKRFSQPEDELGTNADVSDVDECESDVDVSLECGWNR